jgi:Secretion system C-terminal sorting domain
MKKIYTAALLLALNSSLWAVGFQASIKYLGNNLTFYIRPEATINSGFSAMEFFIRYPNTNTLTFSDPAENIAVFPNMGTGSAPDVGFQIETGTSGSDKWARFSYTAPNDSIAARNFIIGTEYAVFTTTVSGGLAAANVQLVHRFSAGVDNEDPYYLTLTGLLGEDVRAADAGSLAPSRLFYGLGGGLSGADYYVPLNSAALPLTLLDFTAKADNKAAFLTWKTANERNVSHFEIERSADSKQWTKMSEKKAGFTEGYAFTDENAFEQSFAPFYRLKIVDYDGRTAYSPIRQVAKGKADDLKIYPNPVLHILTVQNATATSVDILNSVGQVVLKATLDKNGDINVATLPSGIYYLRMGKEQKKFVKL